ncbi:N-acetylmuramoyl-L-alanine amidase [Nonomuraea sp. NN258]|uniref:peptidoglycan recognition protein family protein n=1 Tax=Nonomuraea antri TaxID=2730852 RepID=UPI001569757A|nr:peptidoglycan recognition family protein [Nonomuraea antri]NRQ35972.1 N-acetylmuramoyl-L-alanine amidase [Nonomuraea antri]
MVEIVSRREWGAAAPTGALTPLARTRGVKVHYTGGRVSPEIVRDHDVCVQLVRDVQRMHMSGGRETRYVDIGYSVCVCPHQRVFMGRGPGRLPAANGPGLNAGHYAVLALVGNSGFTEPNDGIKHGIRDAIEYLRREGGAGPEIKGHRDGYATSCPGGPLYEWVKAGAPRPKTSSGGGAPAARLPELRPGDTSPHVVTLRRALGAADTTSKKYDPTDPDLAALVEAFKNRHGLKGGLVWTAECWDILNERRSS